MVHKLFLCMNTVGRLSKFMRKFIISFTKYVVKSSFNSSKECEPKRCQTENWKQVIQITFVFGSDFLCGSRVLYVYRWFSSQCWNGKITGNKLLPKPDIILGIEVSDTYYSIQLKGVMKMALVVSCNQDWGYIKIDLLDES